MCNTNNGVIIYNLQSTYKGIILIYMYIRNCNFDMQSIIRTWLYWREGKKSWGVPHSTLSLKQSWPLELPLTEIRFLWSHPDPNQLLGLWNGLLTAGSVSKKPTDLCFSDVLARPTNQSSRKSSGRGGFLLLPTLLSLHCLPLVNTYGFNHHLTVTITNSGILTWTRFSAGKSLF